MSIRLLGILLVLVLALGAALAHAADPPEVTEDGLVRVPSSRKVGVYRVPDIPFTQYHRITLDGISVSFDPGWLRTNKNLKESDRERIRADLVRDFRDELTRELVERGGYALTDDTSIDVLRVQASIQNLDISAPNAGLTPGTHSFVRSTGSMTLVIELRDAASNVVVARIIDHEHAREFDELQSVNQTINEEDARVAFANAARHTREALNVAKTQRPK
jgi:hypothetical protein